MLIAEKLDMAKTLSAQILDNLNF